MPLYGLNPKLVSQDRKTFRWYYGDKLYFEALLNPENVAKYKARNASNGKKISLAATKRPFPSVARCMPEGDRWEVTDLSWKEPLTETQMRYGSVLASDFLYRLIATNPRWFVFHNRKVLHIRAPGPLTQIYYPSGYPSFGLRLKYDPKFILDGKAIAKDLPNPQQTFHDITPKQRAILETKLEWRIYQSFYDYLKSTC